MINHKTTKLKNEFDEIRNLYAKHEPVINKEDITDFKIDCGLYNQAAQKNLKKTEIVKPKAQRKKRCLKIKPRTRKCKKTNGQSLVSIYVTTKKNSNSHLLNLQSVTFVEKK